MLNLYPYIVEHNPKEKVKNVPYQCLNICQALANRAN